MEIKKQSLGLKVAISASLIYFCPGVPVYLTPWTAPTLVSCPGKSYPPPPHLGYLIFTLGGQAVQASLSCPLQKKIEKNYLWIFCCFFWNTAKIKCTLFVNKCKNNDTLGCRGGCKLSRVVNLTPTWVPGY